MRFFRLNRPAQRAKAAFSAPAVRILEMPLKNCTSSPFSSPSSARMRVWRRTIITASTAKTPSTASRISSEITPSSRS